MFLLLPAFAIAADAQQTAAQLDELFAQRHVPEQMKALEKATTEALKAHPEDYGVLWRAARLKYWQADGATKEQLKKRLGKEGWDLAEKAITKNAGAIEGHYYAAIAMGAYSQAVGILAALSEGLEGKFNERLDKAIALDPGFDNAGPLIAKGRYYYELPWPKRDLGKSAEFLQRAIKTQPAALRAYLYLAETQLKDGEEKKAQQTIEKVFAGGDTYDPAEARRVKQLARSVKAQIEEELK